MRYILVIAAIALLSLVMWPWIAEFFTWVRKEYYRLIEFKTQKTETETETEKEKETKTNDNN